MPFSFTHIAQSLYPKQENLAWVGSEYAQLLKVPLTNLTLQTTLEEHPDYPSLLSLSDAFDTFKIENAAIQIDAEQLETLPPPYIATSKTMVVLLCWYKTLQNRHLCMPMKTANKVPHRQIF